MVWKHGILDNHDRPASIHGAMQDGMHIILRFAEAFRREGKSFLQKNVTAFIKMEISGMLRMLTDCILCVQVIIMLTCRVVNT
jgi:hypothetical protein